MKEFDEWCSTELNMTADDGEKKGKYVPMTEEKYTGTKTCMYNTLNMY